MSFFATLPPGERQIWFEQYASNNGLSEVIVEKDFWVVWTLDRLFALPEIKDHVVFKGGTSLSKVYGAIRRFSEDVDISLSPAYLGWNEADLDEAPSKNQRDIRSKRCELDCIKAVSATILPLLENDFRTVLGSPANGNWLDYEFDRLSASPVLRFNYPQANKSELSYIQKSVKIEFGSLTDQRPTGVHTIQPMVAALSPTTYKDFQTQVVALEVERTFWEKATILHSEYHRPTAKNISPRFARHYSDFACLWRHSGGQKAKGMSDILASVVLHKKRFFSSGYANYETAKFGSLRLTPPAFRIPELEYDYEKMQPMFFNTPLPFSDILNVIQEAETELNSYAQPQIS